MEGHVLSYLFIYIFHGTWRFITVLTKTRHLYVSKAILMLTLAMRMICREDGELLQARKYLILSEIYRGIDKSLGRSGRKQATATEEFDFHIDHSVHVFCLTTGPKPPPKRCLHTVWSRASSFKWEYPLLSLRYPVASYVFFLVFLPLSSPPLSFLR